MLAKKEVVKILESVGIKDTEKFLEVPSHSEFGDLSFTCFGLAKIERRNPKEIAEDLAGKIKIPKDSLVEKVEAKNRIC